MDAMISFALQVELQAIVNGLGALDKMASRMDKIQGQSDALNRSLTAMTRGLRMVGTQLDPLLTKMSSLANEAKSMASSLKMPSIAAHVADVERLARGYARASRQSDSVNVGLNPQDVAAYGRELDKLRSSYNPLFAAAQKYDGELQRINRDERAGAIIAQEAAAARLKAAASYREAMQANRAYGEQINPAATMSARMAPNSQMAFNAYAGVRPQMHGEALREREADIHAYGNAMDSLRAEINPVFEAQRRYEAQLERISHAERVGAVATNEASAARKRAAQSYNEQVEALSRRPSGGIGGMFGTIGKLFAAEQIGRFVWHANATLGSEITRMRMAGDSEQAINQARSDSLYVARNIPGMTEAESLGINRKLRTLAPNATREQLLSLSTDVSAIHDVTGETSESIIQSLSRGPEARGRLGAKGDPLALVRESSAMTRAILAQRGDINASQMAHSLKMSSTWNRMVNDDPDTAYGLLGAMITNFNKDSGNMLNDVQQTLFGGKISSKHIARGAFGAVGEMDVNKTHFYPDMTPGNHGKPIMNMQDTITFDPSKGLMPAVEKLKRDLDKIIDRDHPGNVLTGEARDSARQKLIKNMFDDKSARALSWMLSEQGQGQIERSIENTKNGKSEAEWREFMAQDPAHVMAEFVASLTDASAEFVKLTGVIAGLRMVSGLIRDATEWAHEHPNTTSALQMGGEAIVGNWLLNKILPKIPGVRFLSGGGASAAGAEAAVGAEAGVAGAGAEAGLGSIFAGSIPLPMLKLGALGAIASFFVGKKYAEVGDMASQMGLVPSSIPGSQMDPFSGNVTEFQRPGERGTISADDIPKAYADYMGNLDRFDSQVAKTHMRTKTPEVTEATKPSDVSDPIRQKYPVAPFRPHAMYHPGGGRPDVYDFRFKGPSSRGMAELPEGSTPLARAALNPHAMPSVVPTQNDLRVNDIYAQKIIIDAELFGGGGKGAPSPTSGAPDMSTSPDANLTGGSGSKAPSPASPDLSSAPDTDVNMGSQSQAQQMGFSDRQWNAFSGSISKIESGGKYNIMGGAGGKYAGKYQLGRNEIAETAQHLGVPVPSQQQFLSDPKMQEQFFLQYTSDHYKYLMKNPKFAALSMEDKAKVLAYAHNQGAGGANKWLNGGKAGKDAFGTSGTAYSKAIGAAWPTDIAKGGLPKPPDTSSLQQTKPNDASLDVPRQGQTHVHDISLNLDGELLGRHILESQLDFFPAASSGISGYDIRQGAVAPGMAMRG